MLQDELGVLKKLIDDLTQNGTESDIFIRIGTGDILQATKIACEEIKDRWLKAFFSELPDYSLQRYFYFHLEGIGNLSDTLFFFTQDACLDVPELKWLTAVNSHLLDLTIHLKKYHPRFFNGEVNSSMLWRKKVLEENKGLAALLIDQLKESGLPAAQTSTVISYLKEMINAGSVDFCTFYSLDYYERFISASIMDIDKQWDENGLNRRLIALNFNSLAYAEYYQQQIESQITFAESHQEKVLLLLEERSRLKAISSYDNAVCHSRFPPIKIILDRWLCERVIYLEEQHRLEPENGLKSVQTKLVLNLSVAQIGCLLRVLVEADCFGHTPLTVIMKFVTENFSSKKQREISPGGLSKEYYSTTQVTAGKMITLFQRLIATLKRIFFPLLVVAGAIFHV